MGGVGMTGFIAVLTFAISLIAKITRKIKHPLKKRKSK